MVLRTHALYQLQAKYLKIVMALFLFGAVREYALLRDQNVNSMTKACIVIPIVIEDSSDHSDYKCTYITGLRCEKHFWPLPLVIALKEPSLPNCVTTTFREKAWVTLMLLAGFELRKYNPNHFFQNLRWVLVVSHRILNFHQSHLANRAAWVAM